MTYVIMRCSEKDLDNYGKILRVDSYKVGEKTKEQLSESIERWKDRNCLPEIVEDPKMIEILDCLSNRDMLNDNQIQKYKEDIQDAINTLERLL